MAAAGRATRALQRRWRPLKVFAFDPSRGLSRSNVITVEVPYEPLAPGPIGATVAVVDPAFEAVHLDSPEITLRGGLDPSELDVRFHQQMVYAVAMRTITDFERGLGRRVRWPWSTPANDRIEDRLRIEPHAERTLNAYFEPDTGSLKFGYDTPWEGDGMSPEQVIYTCLGYDVIAHETLHALHLALLPHHFRTNEVDTFAFLEGLDDLTIVLHHFTFADALLEALVATGGRIDAARSADAGPSPSPLLEIAPQLGTGFGMVGGIRSGLRSPPDPAALRTEKEPHARGAILAAAFLDAFFAIHRRRTIDLERIAGHADGEDLHPDLARRLAAEATKTARHFLDIVARSIDYCPPDGTDLGDFLRAVITADAAHVPNDPWAYREAILSACRARGIYPKGVTSFTEDGLRWPSVVGSAEPPPPCEGVDVRAPEAENIERLTPWVRRHRSALGLPARGRLRVEAAYARATRSVGGARPGRELAVRVMVEGARTPRGSTIILDEHGDLRHVITRAQAPARRRRGGEPGATPDGTDVIRRDLAAAGRSRRPTPFDRRPLRILAFDPGRGRTLGNHVTVSVPYEKLSRGPVGGKIAVVDYDASNDRYYEAVDLDDPAIVLAGGLEPTPSDPGFHQQMVYAVVSATIERFESTLGRPVVWRWARPDAKGAFAGRLLVHPHAMQEANAFYDPLAHALAFGYFARRRPDGVPTDEIVYTCLSHDVVVHETTHAVLDSFRRYFLEPTGADAPAFHEAFADIVALLQHFTFPEALIETIAGTGGRLHSASIGPEGAAAVTDSATIAADLRPSNPFVELAREFGEALGSGRALRSALGTPPNELSLDSTREPHDRGAILVSAVFDAFFTVYVRASADLMRMARHGGTISPAGDVHPALAARLAREATDAAARFAEMCIRALDYCPPIDIEFGDFLRALVTGQWDISADDRHEAVEALITAFRSRGIVPSGIRTISEDALRWPRSDLPDDVRCEGLDPEPRSPSGWQRNAILLGRFAREHAEALGLSPALAIRVHQAEAVASQRLDPHGGLSSQVHAQLTQRRSEPMIAGDPSSPSFTFRGGSTVVLDEAGRVRYVIAKPIADDDRLVRQRAYLVEAVMDGLGAAYLEPTMPRIDLAALHRAP
jgi:hypothetical protein